MKRISIALVGGFDEKMHTRVAPNNSIDHCRPNLNFEVDGLCVSTDSIHQTIFEENKFQGFLIFQDRQMLTTT